MLTAHGRMRMLIAATALGIAVAVAAPAAGAPSVRDSAADTLANAVTSLQGLGYNVSGTSGSTASGGTGSLTGTGSVNPGANGATIEFKGAEQGDPIDVAFTQIGDAFYARLDIGSAQSQLGAGPNQWLTVDTSKLTNPQQAVPFDLSGASDALDIGGLLTSTNDVKFPNPSDQTKIAGTVDLTAAQGVSAPTASELGAAGKEASATPFSATVDGQGRLTDLKIDADGFDGNLTEEIKFADFGSPGPVTAPPNTVPAPASTYAFFNG